MIFWEISFAFFEWKSIPSRKGKIVTRTFPKARLHVTKVSCLGRDPRTHLNARFLKECSVGGQPPTAICKFGEDDGEVHFSVYGCNFKEETVHLSGFFIDQ
ncbi:hypothetical protein MKW92_023936 [Papaver armeniacum]|nr:hypothetical protein MKW92_023936 [Papaver armeniacum]